jgi:DNA-binding PadR family transcriptional regulator
MRDLTELDFCVLGVIWRSGPMTAYGVRKVFRDSTTAGWSSSSGSIYPSIRRLLTAGLASAGSPEDRRGTQTLTITPEGLDRLKGWILGLGPELGTATPDPIRTRAQFITTISAEDRAKFVEAARRITTDALRLLEQVAEANAGDRAQVLDQLGTLGSILELKGRLEWLDRISDVLSE